ncbi:MAG TPA: serine kinase [Gammaproteobacteria bacterium]|nr:serine kinase [Gammaproteobacteria bacterium]
MKDVYVLQYVHYFDDGTEDVKVIGIYDANESALAAIERFKSQPGFCDFPELVDPSGSAEVSGFNLDSYPLYKDHWSEGFLTC